MDHYKCKIPYSLLCRSYKQLMPNALLYACLLSLSQCNISSCRPGRRAGICPVLSRMCKPVQGVQDCLTKRRLLQQEG